MNRDIKDIDKSLSDVNASVKIKSGGSFIRRLLTFTGPAFMVSVGYMDPGNWATDLAAGSRFGYRLIWVILLSNIMAILFQTLSARLGIVMGKDLAQACRERYPRPVSIALWILCEIAIAATDLAEILGSAVGLYLLTGLPIIYGVIITAFDVMLLLMLESFGIRKIEAIIVTLVATIGICFGIEMFISKPVFSDIARGFIPTPLSSEALYIAIGIIGATVMPHNLYLHSALVQSRAIERTDAGLSQATKFNLIDSVVALNGAFFVNASILILAAATFFKSGLNEVGSIIEAHKMLAPLLGTSIASVAFAVALLASGQSSTITGTYAGQIVMEGFVGMRIRPWLRRLITRIIAIIPAVITIYYTGENGVDTLLILSQVILSLQLPFALVPLLHITSDKKKMKRFASSMKIKVMAWISAGIIILLNLKLVYGVVIEGLVKGGVAGYFVKTMLIPGTVVLIPMLIWMICEPFLRDRQIEMIKELLLPKMRLPEYKEYQPLRNIGVALEAHDIVRDEQILAGVIPLIHSLHAKIVLMHVVESAAGRLIGASANDSEMIEDTMYLEKIADKLKNVGIHSKIRIGAG